MGACYSCRTSAAFDSIRVVHFSGFVEDFENPISVSQVTGKPPKHFVCTPAQFPFIVTDTVSNLLKPDTQLEPGKLYFLMPSSMLKTEISLLDLASTYKRLTRVAKTSRRSQSQFSRPSPAISPHDSTPFLNTEISLLDLASTAKRLTRVARTNCRSQAQFSRPSPFISPHDSNPLLNSPYRSHNRFWESEPEASMVAIGAARRSSWKSILNPIREMSFGRRIVRFARKAFKYSHRGKYHYIT